MANNIEPDGVVGLVVGFMLGALVVIAIWCLSGAEWRKDAITRGYGEYNSATGKWQWKEPNPTKGN